MAKRYESYAAMHKLSIERPDEFWAEYAERLHWYRKWDRVLDADNPPFFRWFTGGETNICYNAIDRHALGTKRGQAAIIWESPETGQRRTITYFELYREVNRFAGALKGLGLKKSDRVIIYMPMIPEALIAMYACVRIGAIHSVVFAGFSRESLADRINDAAPKLLICADGGRRKGKAIDLKKIVDEGIAVSTAGVEKVIVFDRGISGWNRVEGRDIDWNEALERSEIKMVDPERMKSTDPSYILYTSGTTGKPKGVVRDTGGHIVALLATMELIYNCVEGDVYWSTSDIGWVVGHSYNVYAPLLAGLTTVIFEGTPDIPNPGIWWEIVQRYGITHIFSAPTAMRILRKFPSKWMEDKDISSLKYIFLAGEPLDEPTYQWVYKTFGKEVIDHYWQTETGWAILSNMPGVEALPIKPGSPTKAAMGYKLEVVDENGSPLERGNKGFLVAHPPLPPGNLMTIWGNDARYIESYWKSFPGKMLYMTGDYAIEDADGYFWVLGRADEVINVAGHRMGTREVEEQISSHPAVAEACSIGVVDELKGQAIASFCVLKQDVAAPEDRIRGEIFKMIRDRIGAIAVPRELHFVRALPKTRSGKIMRRVLKALVEKAEIGDISTIEDGVTIDEIKSSIDGMGWSK